MTLQLSKCVVEVKDELTWWDEEELKSVIASAFRFGANAQPEAIDTEKYMKAKIKILELSIVSIKENDKTIPFSVDWLKRLSKDDGKKLSDATKLDSLASLGSKK